MQHDRIYKHKWSHFQDESFVSRLRKKPFGLSLAEAKRRAKAIASPVAPRPISPLIGRPSSFSHIIKCTRDVGKGKIDELQQTS